MTLTQWSERTIRRRVADGSLPCVSGVPFSNKTLISLESIKADICLTLSDEDIELLKSADAGSAQAQTEMALLFLENGKEKSAIYWLEQAAKQNFPDALHWMGNCYLRGEGFAKDDNLAVMWIAKAASLGHSVAKLQIEALSRK
ncbi:sel1 repeat family protein [Methylomonas sp. SURF-2]|uniref:Sel1 repeat family protein n=1 Tax=Methylomonas subterranea TaxID=2952225 RepID=A0ABT1TJ51_9GAMM|nr:tetratricopeptide repeat protein [Methylomonas sp. SURF-2]MCQ8105494.1 sel1 repeat family protein [Methylomonas sp. SURF-2]